MTKTRGSVQSYQEGIKGFVEKNNQEVEKEKKEDLEDAKYVYRKTNSIWAARASTGFNVTKEEILGVTKKPESAKPDKVKTTKKESKPAKEGKSTEEEIMDESKLRSESIRLAEVDLNAAKWGISKKLRRKMAGFTEFQIKQIMIYREAREKEKELTIWDHAANVGKSIVKVFKPEPTPEERLQILKEKKQFYNDMREKYNLPKKH